MKLFLALLVGVVALSSAKDDLLKELDNELLFDILQQRDQTVDNDGNFCANKANGDYADPSDCAKYITCSNGHAITDRDCPSGLYFNPKTSACDYPNKVDCSSKGNVDCSGKPDGNYQDPNNCHGFIMCSNGIPYHMTCPSNLKYDKNTKNCEHPDKVDCSSARDDVEYATDKRSQATPSKDPFCQNKPNGNYVNPYKCEGFIMCSNHLTYFFDCPSILQYNPKTDRCDWPQNVKCGPGPSPTKPQPPPPTPSTSQFCKRRPNGNYVDPNNCNGFIMCSNHLTYFFDCPANLRYNVKKDWCDWPWNVDCNPTATPPVTRPSTKPPPTPSSSKFCKNRANGNYVDPNNCNGFIMCSNHLTYFFDCPANLRYNVKTDRCDWPWNVDCNPTATPPVTRPTRPPPTPSPSKFCKNRADGNYVDPNNCNGFIMCSNHLTYFFDCPANLRYNVKKDWCDWPWNVDCNPTVTPPVTRPSTKPPPTPSSSKFCKNRADGNYVDPNNCNGFIMCSNHLTYFFDCPANLRYNPKKDWCDWPRNVKCPPKMSSDALLSTPSKKSEFCKKHGNGNYRDVTNCEGYFTCYFGFQIFRDCPGTQRFNPKTNRCDLPRNVKCGGAGGGTRGSGFCKNRPNGDYTDVLNCNGFIKCSNSYTYYFDCPSILRFNEPTDRCDWPRNVRCSY